MIEPVENVHQPGHHGTGVRWLDIGIAVCLPVMSLASLYVAVHTGETMTQLVDQNERLVRAQSTPVLQFKQGDYVRNTAFEAGRPSLSFELTNVGSGSARIVWFRFGYAGKKPANVKELLGVIDPEWRQDNYATNDANRIVLQSGARQILLAWPKPSAGEARAAWQGLESARWQLKTQACYCSIFEECWVANLSGDIPRKVKACA